MKALRLTEPERSSVADGRPVGAPVGTSGARAASLAAQGVYVGTSSWKYSGWCGMLYDRARYEYRGKFAETRFKRDCLREYAEVFQTVCVDAA